MRPLPLVPRVAIGIWCLWHMTAVALYALPSNTRFEGVRSTFSPVTRPYMLILSQWQQWNLFSPNPVRRITNLRVDARTGSIWKMYKRVTPESAGVFERASWEKFKTNLLSENSESHDPFQRRFLQYQCKELGLPGGTLVRLAVETQLLPHDDWIHPVAWWTERNPEINSQTVSTITCPS